MDVPKIIHQSHVNRRSAEEYNHNITRLQKLNPDWRWMCWTDDDNLNLIQEHYPWFLSTYESYKYPIQRADAVRYFYMHKYGGIYLDLDMYPFKPINLLLKKINDGDIVSLHDSWYPDVMLFEEYPNYFFYGVIYNAIIISKPEANFWTLVHYMLKESVQKMRSEQDREKLVFNTTGPEFLYECFKQYVASAAFNKVGVLPYFYSNPAVLSNKHNPDQKVYFGSQKLRELYKSAGDDAAWGHFPKIGKDYALDNPALKDAFFLHESFRTWKAD